MKEEMETRGKQVGNGLYFEDCREALLDKCVSGGMRVSGRSKGS